MNTAASSDEKIMAALVHGSVFLMFLGPIVPVIIWASQRKKSKYVSFHALQAMGYQALIFWAWIVVTIVVAIFTVILLPLGITLIENPRDVAAFPFLFQIPIFAAIFGIMGLSFVTGLAGGILCLLGRDFHYPFLGTWLQRYLFPTGDPGSEISETREDNWVAGVCHATAILQLWGVVTPLIVWFSQKERSARLRFQSMQAFVYQFIALAVYLLGMGVYMVFFLGTMFTLILGSSMGRSSDLQGAPAVIMLVFLGVMMVFWFVMMIGMPIYYLLAGLAGVRVIRGHDFHYPILGRMIERRMATAQIAEAT